MNSNFENSTSSFSTYEGGTGHISEFNNLKFEIERKATPEQLNASLSEWIEPDDNNIPYKFLEWSIAQILQTPFSVFARSWNKDDRLSKFIILLHRVCQSVSTSTGILDEAVVLGRRSEFPAPGDRQINVSGTTWRTWCEIIENHDIGNVTLGAVATSLKDLPSSFWNSPLCEFTSITFLELSKTPGLGPRKLSIIVELIREVATHIEMIPTNSSLGIVLMPKPIREISVWLSEVLAKQKIPSTDEIALYLCRPLRMQLQTDLSPKVAAVVLRRLGFTQESETLEEIAKNVGLTRERVRQLALRATDILHVRWPLGKFLLDDLYELLSSAPDSNNQVILIRNILDRCFDVDINMENSCDEVLDEFRAAARQRQTPMTEHDIRAWASSRFRLITPDEVFNWISTNSATWSDSSGKQYFFSDECWDTLLLKILVEKEPMAISDAARYLDLKERSVIGHVSRDFRFIEIENKMVQAAHFCGVNRVDSKWQIKLDSSTPNNLPRVANISVESLIEIVMSGLLHLDIADATVWGVHRYTNQMLQSVYNAKLPDSLTPFELQEVLVSHSNRLIRRMRRRRLRWDAVLTTPARGKIGWISYVSRKTGIPMTIEEMQEELSKYYQDYEPYVLQQLNLAEEDGETSLGVSMFRGIPQRIPPLIIPDEWELDCKSENISEQLKFIAGKIVDIGRRRGFPRSELKDLPWMIALVDHYSYGKMNWSEVKRDSINSTIPQTDKKKVQNGASSDEFIKHSEKKTTSNSTTYGKDGSNASDLNSIIEQLDSLLE